MDRNRAHVWKPMLHTFAAGTSDYANENVSFIPHAKLTGYKYWPGDFGGLDRQAQTINLKPTQLPAAGEMLTATKIHYDTLILALGSEANDFATPGVKEHCHFIDDIREATAFNDLLRSEVVLAANAGKDLDVVIVGGGATGVELAAELTERMEIVSSYGSDVTRTHLRLTLIETTSRVLGPFPEKISRSVEAKLGSLGVDVRTSTKVVGVDAQGVSLDGGRRIKADLVVWAAGVKGPAVMSNLDGVEINRRGQVQVGDTLQTLSDERIFRAGRLLGPRRCRWKPPPPRPLRWRGSRRCSWQKFWPAGAVAKRMARSYSRNDCFVFGMGGCAAAVWPSTSDICGRYRRRRAGTGHRQPPEAGLGPRRWGGDRHLGRRNRAIHPQSRCGDGHWGVRFNDDRFFFRDRTGGADPGRRLLFSWCSLSRLGDRGLCPHDRCRDWRCNRTDMRPVAPQVQIDGGQTEPRAAEKILPDLS